MIEQVIFDIDGTLIDSVDAHAESWKRIFREHGKDVPFLTIRRQIGKGADQLLPVFWTDQELAEFGQTMQDERANLFKQAYLSGLQPFPQVRELFLRLREDGRRLRIASSATEEDLARFLEIAGIADLVEKNVSSDDAERSKPHPDIFVAALKAAGNPERGTVLVVGDTPYDAQAAAKAGLRTIGVLCGGFPEKELRDAGCIAVFRDPADLLEQYDQSPLARD